MCSVWREGFIHCINRAAAQVKGSSCWKCGYTQTIKKCLHFIIGKTKVVFWGRKYFHWKNVSTLYFLFSSPGRSSAVDVMEAPRWSNPRRMEAKIFPLFMLLLLMKIILLCVMLQTHHYSLILGTFPPSSGDIISGDSLGLDQMNPSKSKRILKYVCAGSQWLVPVSGTTAGYLPCNAWNPPKNQNGLLQVTYKGLASCQTQTVKNHETGQWVEWCYAPSTLTLGLFWFVCVNKNWEIFSFNEGMTHTMKASHWVKYRHDF